MAQQFLFHFWLKLKTPFRSVILTRFLICKICCLQESEVRSRDRKSMFFSRLCSSWNLTSAEQGSCEINCPTQCIQRSAYLRAVTQHTDYFPTCKKLNFRNEFPQLYTSKRTFCTIFRFLVRYHVAKKVLGKYRMRCM